jgi:hypothetical protein
MAGFAETVGRQFTSERRPDPGLLLRAMDRMTVAAQRLGDETQILRPFAGSWIVHGTLDPQLVLMAVRAEIVAERTKERRGLGPNVRVVATITGDLRLRTRRICRTGFSGWGVVLRSSDQGMMRSLRLFYPSAVVASTAEIGSGTGRRICRHPGPQVGTMCVVSRVA